MAAGPRRGTQYLLRGLMPGRPRGCTTVPRLICVRGWHQTREDCYQMIDRTPALQLSLTTTVYVLPPTGPIHGGVKPPIDVPSWRSNRRLQ